MASDERVQVQVRMPQRLLERIDERHARKQRELEKAGFPAKIWSRNDQILEMLEAGVKRD
jgi:hypothetical protein